MALASFAQPARCLSQRKEPPSAATYGKPMTRAPCPFPLRLCLALLPVLMLLAGTGAQAFAEAQAITVVICSDGDMKTVRIGANGTAKHGPAECRDCSACIPPLAGGLPRSADPARPAEWRPVVHPRRAAAAPLSRPAPAPLSRGPPRLFPWLNA